MTNLVDKVKSRISPNSFATKFSRDGCSVNLKGAPQPHVLIDMDKELVSDNDVKCDYIFVGGTGNAWVVPIELKRGSAEAKDVVEQLRAGARFAEEKICKEAQVCFVPVVGCGRIKSAQRQELRKRSNRIAFHGRPVEVRVVRCRGLLTSVLK